ncbi:MAG: Gfo/Idh/MocA family oxidoreductase [FCB group bacterium]|jgi:predicted dehydrogenase|nr:Gfo/Idh/MocA family oxidoreductase [FCB group bacterium]
MSRLTRRSFLAASASSLAAPALAGVLAQARTASAQVAPSEKVRVGLIGCGGIGLVDMKTFFLNAEVDCPVVCDIDDSHIASAVSLVEAERGHKPDTVKDFRQVIDRKDVDVVLVCTPDHWHALPTVYACQAGKDVYTEKPLGQCIEEGRAMREAMRENKRVVQMGTQWRSGTHFRDAVEFIQSGKIGKVRQVRAWAYLDWLGGLEAQPDGEPPAGVDYDMWLGPAPLRPFNPNRFHFNFRWFWDYAGGLMTDWGVHLLNVCLWAMGPEFPKNVYSAGGKRILADNTETPDTQVAVYDFPSYTLIWEHQVQGGVGIGGRPHGASFSGSEGTVIIHDAGWEVIPEPKKNSVEAAKHDAGVDARPAHVRNFLDCVKSRQAPVENLDLGFHVSTVAALGNIALRSGSLVTWDAIEERGCGTPEAQKLAMTNYRAPWTLPYSR